MSFLKNNAYWIVAVVIGLGISVVILSQHGDREPISPPQKTIETPIDEGSSLESFRLNNDAGFRL